ncbi:MAG: ornithine--oxo-acid transaminase [Vicinamibacteria bacterium]|nr:ornithine--oxo-acid transaminase [Vicinamibacteria bacterium]
MRAETAEAQAIEWISRYGTYNYQPLPIAVHHARESRVWDTEGRDYLDCIGCYSAVSCGHLNPAVVAAIGSQLHKLAIVGRAVNATELGVFLKRLCEYAQMDRACPMNSGAEAVETAIKIARKWAYTVKGVPREQAEIIVAEGNFHGRTTTIVGFSSEARHRADFGPFASGFRLVPFGDLAAVEAAFSDQTAAVLMEPIQAEGGIILPPPGFMAGLRRLCAERNVLLIWDEIQTGFCRTGIRFAWQHEDARPDMVCLGKALGGGVYPVSAVAGRDDVMGVLRPGDHGSTFGGNPLAAVVGLAAMDEMDRMGLAERSRRLGSQLHEGLAELRLPVVKDVRGRGLLVGLEVDESVCRKSLTRAFLRVGILTQETRARTYRFAPPLTIEEDDVFEIVRRAAQALATAS